MAWKYGGFLILATICQFSLFSRHVDGQGVATGWVIANAETLVDDITPGENTTHVFAGPGSLNTTSQSFSSDGAVKTQASFPEVKVRVDSSGLADQKVAYGAAYFEDSITILGGVGSFEMSMRWDFDGGISGLGGEYWIGDEPDTGLGGPEGNAAANFRVFLGGFGQGNLDLTDPDLFKDVAVEPRGDLIVPYFNPLDDGSSLVLPGDDSIGNFIFDRYLDGEPTGEFVEAWYTDENADALGGLGGGARFTWDYGVPLEFGVLLEGWASDGGVVDFFNTGTFTEIVLPGGASLVSSGGGTYNVTSVPEPTAASLLAIGLLGGCLRRKRILA